MLQVGRTRVLRVVESEDDVLSPFELYPDCNPRSLLAARDTLAPANFGSDGQRLIVSIQGFVIATPELTILVDTCVGDCKERRRPAFDRQSRNWLRKLEEAGFPRDSIDIVVCTHLHVDHVGGNTQWVEGSWQPTFPNARYLFTRPDWAHWSGDSAPASLERTGDYVADSLLPVVEAGLVDLVDPNHRVSDEVRLVPAPGHSPGMVMVRIDSHGQSLVLAGDLLHSPLQCLHPDWSTRFCVDPDESRRTRLHWLAQFARSQEKVLPSHFAAPGIGRIERSGAHYFFRFEK